MKNSASLIKVTNLGKTYRNGSINYSALHDVNFQIDQGEMVAIMGPSGSGKSTTMHILGLLDTADEGSYELNGRTIKRSNEDRLAEIRNQDIGFVFQSFNLLPRVSVADNVELPLVYRGMPAVTRQERVKHALAQVGLRDKATSMPNQISGGQVQRVAIARALVTNPALILADEPTGNLDSKTSLDVMRVFQQLHSQGKTIVLITHEQIIADCCQRVISLQDGTIVSDTKNTHINKLI